MRSINTNKKDATMSAAESPNTSLSRLVVCVCLALGCAGSAVAQRWSIDPSIEGQATLTNNANLNNGSEREGDLILSVTPRVSFLREGGRLRVNGSAALELIGYANGTQESRIYPQANILANLEAVERVFFVEAELLANQQYLNPFLPRSDTSDSTFNSYTYVQGRIAPYLQGNLGADWRYLLRSDNTYTYTTQSEATLDDAYYGKHVGEVARNPTPLGGSLRVQRDVTRFKEQDLNQRLDLALATLNYAFTPQFVVGLRGGYERTNYTFSEDSGSVYGAELLWTPNPRTRLSGFWQERFFGPEYEAEFTYRQRTLAANLSASRTISTYPQLLLQLPGGANVSNLLNAILVARVPDPIERQRQVQDLIDRQQLPATLPGGVRVFSQGVNLVESVTATLAWIGSRNSLALSPYYLKTESLPDARIPPAFIDFNNNRQRGVSLTLTHQLTRLVLLTGTLSRSETRSFGTTAPESIDQNVAEAQATRQLSPTSSAFIGARYQNWNSTSATFGDSHEAAVFVGIVYGF